MKGLQLRPETEIQGAPGDQIEGADVLDATTDIGQHITEHHIQDYPQQQSDLQVEPQHEVLLEKVKTEDSQHGIQGEISQEYNDKTMLVLEEVKESSSKHVYKLVMVGENGCSAAVCWKRKDNWSKEVMVPELIQMVQLQVPIKLLTVILWNA